MPPVVDNAVCIRCWDFSETSQTVSLFSRDHGILRGLAKGAKREKGDFSGGLDVLTRGEVMAIIKPGRDLATLTGWHLQESYPWLRRSLSANRAALYAADLIHHMLVEHDPHPKLYDAFTAALEDFQNSNAVDATLLRLQWAVLGEAGYQPELNRDAQSGEPLPANASTLTFSTTAGGVVAETTPLSGTRWRVRRETIQVLRSLAAGEFPAEGDNESLRRANRLLAVHLREIIGSELSTMRWAFADLNV